MSKFTEITQIFRKIDQARFQLACIDYLKNNVGGEVHSPGTVDDKEKTRKSHPDIYLKQPDGNYVLAECTTKDDSNQAAFVNKLKGDLMDCLDFEKLKVPQEKVARVYLCSNSTIEPGIYEQLEDIIRPHKIRLVIVGIHELASYFCSGGKVFAKDSLGVAFQTGQILNKEQFLAQYGKKNISTPLDNPVIGREVELQALSDTLVSSEIVIISGPPGVGKSRLAMEVIDKFTSENAEYNAFYIFSKTGEITDDLATFLKPDKAYVLLVDDANRQIENLTSILEKLIESEMRLKVILTVRDYARADLERQCGNLGRFNFPLFKLSDEKIEQIISAKPFLIKDWKIKYRIRQICNGNPRLAIMAANVMESNADINILSDVTRIYDEYFHSVLNDKSLFDNKTTRQVLGLIAYFNTLDITDELDRGIIEDFGVSVDEFFDIALQLQDMEVIEIYDNSVVKISEQVLSTYFFYCSFFRDKVLSFEKLLSGYFQSYFHRVRDAVLGAINAFGPGKIIIERSSDWKEFWSSIEADEVLTIQFLQIFGTHFHANIFDLVNRKTLPPLGENNFELSMETIKNVSKLTERDAALELLKSLYQEAGTIFETAVYLGFKYALKGREQLASFAEDLSGTLFIDRDEFENGFARINFVYSFLKQNFELHPFYKIAFYHIFDRVIVSATGRENLYDLESENYKLTTSFRDFRARFFQDLGDSFKAHYPLGFEVLLSYSTEKYDLRYLEIIADKLYIIAILGKLNPARFGDCYLVQKYCCKVENATSEQYGDIEQLGEGFRCKSYILFEKLNIEYGSSEGSWGDFHQRKTEAICSSLQITDLADWQTIEQHLSEIYQFIGDVNVYGDGVSILLRNILSKDIALGFDCLKSYLQKDNFLGLSGASVFSPIMAHSLEKTKELLSLMEEVKFDYQNSWFRDFFHFLPEAYIDLEYVEKFVGLFRDWERTSDIYADYLHKFDQHTKDTTESILAILVSRKNADDKFVYKLEHEFFKKSPHLLKNSFELCKQVYFQQQSMPGSYDIDSRELFILIEKNKSFFYEYLDTILQKKKHYTVLRTPNLTRVWGRSDAEELVYNSLLKIANTKNGSSSDHPGVIFFYSLKDEQTQAIHRVFSKLVNQNSADLDVMNLVIDTLRNYVRKHYMKVFSEFLDKNRDISFFKALHLHNNHFSTTSNQIWPEAKAKELQELIDMISKMPMQYVYFEHLAYLNERIEQEKRAAKIERKLMFRGYW